MKKTALFLAVLALVFVSCSKLERNEKKFVNAMLDEDYATSNQGLEDFYKWLQTDKETMTYEFPLMREKYGMKVNTSSDGMVRLYSWVTNPGGEPKNYANVAQWTMDDQLVAYTGPIDALLTGRKPNIKRQWSLNHSIDTLYTISEATQPIYMVVESYVNENGYTFVYISAFINQGIKLAIMPFFFNGIETAGNREFIDDGTVNKAELIKWDDKARKLYAYVTDDSLRVIPGKYETYALGPKQFNKIETE